jgi:D-alanyl-D-alanine carboxypeptidase
MTFSEAARTGSRRTRSAILAALVLVSAAATGAAVSQIDVLHGNASTTLGPRAADIATDQQATGAPALQGDHERPGQRDQAASLTEAGRVRGGGVTVFDDQAPAVANLDPALLGALRQAATDAADDEVEFHVNSGWRSAEYQERLLRAAISEYGSEEEAARWVATPEKSAHVSGDAVDIGPSDAAAWLSEHGSGYGLCRIYKNEPWHFELRPEAVDHGCPAMYADPTHDPRMQQ